MKHSAGHIRVLEGSPMQQCQHQRMVYLPELTAFPQNLSCMNLLSFAVRSCGLSKAEGKKNIRYWLERLGLWEARHRLLRNFSKGMLQRTSFAMSLVHDPELLILDEPMSGLDPVGRIEIVSLIQELRNQGKSILFCSHVLDDVERLSDQVLILNKGHVCFQGEVSDLCQSKSDWRVTCNNREEQSFSDSSSLAKYVEKNAEYVKNIQHHESFEEAFVRVIQEER